MPVISPSNYRSPLCLRHGHLQTIWPTLFRSLPDLPYARHAVRTEDGEALAVDVLGGDFSRAAVISHGLCGHSRRPYAAGMALALHRAGWDSIVWNMRGCGGHVPAVPRFTHNGSTGDLRAVVDFAAGLGNYTTIALAGFSMGANLTLLHLAREAQHVHPLVSACAAFSVPLDLADCARRISRWSNRLYLVRFLRKLKRMLQPQARRFPDVVDLENYGEVRDFEDFDGRYTAPLHGFSSALDYWTRCSAGPHLAAIRVPTLVVNAADDPFLGPTCYPFETARISEALHLEVPRHGGHCGFMLGHGAYWAEHRAVEWFGNTGHRRR